MTTSSELFNDRQLQFQFESVSLAPRARVARRVPAPFNIGDIVSDSSVGAGVITSFSGSGAPRVNDVAVFWLERGDGAVYGVRKRHMPSQPHAGSILK